MDAGEPQFLALGSGCLCAHGLKRCDGMPGWSAVLDTYACCESTLLLL